MSCVFLFFAIVVSRGGTISFAHCSSFHEMACSSICHYEWQVLSQSMLLPCLHSVNNYSNSPIQLFVPCVCLYHVLLALLTPLHSLLLLCNTEQGAIPENVFMVSEYMEYDLTGILDTPEIRFMQDHIKSWSQQLFAVLITCTETRFRGDDLSSRLTKEMVPLERFFA